MKKTIILIFITFFTISIQGHFHPVLAIELPKQDQELVKDWSEQSHNEELESLRLYLRSQKLKSSPSQQKALIRFTYYQANLCNLLKVHPVQLREHCKLLGMDINNMDSIPVHLMNKRLEFLKVEDFFGSRVFKIIDEEN